MIETTTKVNDGAIVIFAKYPISGSSKTRLSPLLGDDGSASLARAMLSDVIEGISFHPVLRRKLKFIVYAPDNDIGKKGMREILDSLNLTCKFVSEELSHNCRLIEEDEEEEQDNDDDDIHDSWLLLPMSQSSNNTTTTTQTTNDLTSSDLGEKLSNALSTVQTILLFEGGGCSGTWSIESLSSSHDDSILSNTGGPVAFVGMDSPELPLDEIANAFQIASPSFANNDNNNNNNSHDHKKKNHNGLMGKAYLCPANDGGYGMLCVPSHTPSSIFENIKWSHPLTAIYQLKRITDSNINVKVGNIMHDIDEPNDVIELAKRLCKRYGGLTLNEHYQYTLRDSSQHHFNNNDDYDVPSFIDAICEKKEDSWSFSEMGDYSTNSESKVTIWDCRHTLKLLMLMNLIVEKNVMTDSLNTML